MAIILRYLSQVRRKQPLSIPLGQRHGIQIRNTVVSSKLVVELVLLIVQNNAFVDQDILDMFYV